jgi:hypothetical protein
MRFHDLLAVAIPELKIYDSAAAYFWLLLAASGRF